MTVREQRQIRELREEAERRAVFLRIGTDALGALLDERKAARTRELKRYRETGIGAVRIGAGDLPEGVHTQAAREIGHALDAAEVAEAVLAAVVGRWVDGISDGIATALANILDGARQDDDAMARAADQFRDNVVMLVREARARRRTMN